MSGTIPRIMLMGELPEVLIDMPPELKDAAGLVFPVKQWAMGYSLKGVRQERDLIKATLCVRNHYILTSGEETKAEEVALRLTFHRNADRWLCTVENHK